MAGAEQNQGSRGKGFDAKKLFSVLNKKASQDLKLSQGPGLKGTTPDPHQAEKIRAEEKARLAQRRKIALGEIRKLTKRVDQLKKNIGKENDVDKLKDMEESLKYDDHLLQTWRDDLANTIEELLKFQPPF